MSRGYGDGYDGRYYTHPTASRPPVSSEYYHQGSSRDSYRDDRQPRHIGDDGPPEFNRQPSGHIPPSVASYQYRLAPDHAGRGHYHPPSDASYGVSSGYGNVSGSGNYSEYLPPNGQLHDSSMHLTSPQQDGSHHSPIRGRVGSGSIISDEHPAVISTLDPRYALQPSSYYTAGKIFAILWHENHGVSNGHGNGTVISYGPTFTGRFNEPIHSTIRRMVVFSTTRNKSLCFPISTYGNRGVAKRNVDPYTHAIVYPRGTPPIQGANEPRMVKEPLEVAIELLDETLNPMSRLDFGKVHTVEHNVKVLPIGRITSRSMTRFIQYTKDEMSNLVQ